MGTQNQAAPNEDVLEFAQAIQLLKEIIRKRKISYKELAKKLGLSESGIKKIFYGDDCSFRRLSQICRVLDCRLIDILDQIDRKKQTRVQFSVKQQRAFLKDALLFSIFVNLVIERQSLEKVKVKYRLNDQRLFGKLKKLDELGLLVLKERGRVGLPPLSQVTTFGEGPLLEKMYVHWSDNLVKAFAKPKYQQNGSFVIRGLSLRKETFDELRDRLVDLDREFLRRGIREMNTFSDEIKPFRWVSIIDHSSLTDDSI